MRPVRVLANLLFLFIGVLPVGAQAAQPQELQADVVQLWDSIVQKGRLHGGATAPELVIVPGPGALDAALKPNASGRPVVYIGQALILSLLRIAQANVYVFAYASADVGKKTALGSYIQEVARGLARAERQGTTFEPVEISQFFKMSEGEWARLAADEYFNREARRQFRSMMIFVLAHEYAHFALSHHTRPAASGSQEQLAQEMEADGLAHRLVRDIDATLVMGATLPMVFYLAHFFESARRAEQVRELCKRAIDNADDDVKFVLDLMRRQPRIVDDMRRMGIDPHAYEQAGQQFNEYRAICEAYGRN